MNKANRNTLSNVVQLKTGHGALRICFEKVKGLERNHKCGCCQPEAVGHLLKDCAFCKSRREHLRKSLP